MKKILLTFTVLYLSCNNMELTSSFSAKDLCIEDNTRQSSAHNRQTYANGFFSDFLLHSFANHIPTNSTRPYEAREQKTFSSQDEIDHATKKRKLDVHLTTEYWSNPSTIHSQPIQEVVINNFDVIKQTSLTYTSDGQKLSLPFNARRFAYDLWMKCKESGQDLSYLISLIEADLYPHHSSNLNAASNVIFETPLQTELLLSIEYSDRLASRVGSGINSFDFPSNQYQNIFNQNPINPMWVKTTTENEVTLSLNFDTYDTILPQHQCVSTIQHQGFIEPQTIDIDNKMSITFQSQEKFITFYRYHVGNDISKCGGKRGKQFLVTWNGSSKYLDASRIKAGLATRWQVLKYIETYQFSFHKQKMLCPSVIRNYIKNLPQYVNLSQSTFGGYYSFMYHYGTKEETIYLQNYKCHIIEQDI